MSVSFEDRFWSKVNKNGPIPAHCQELGQCWIWTGYLNPRGYGLYSLGRKSEGSSGVHRVSWRLCNGEFDNSLNVCHKCDNPACVNPSHLFLGSQQDNMTDMVGKDRSCAGDKHGRRKHPECVPRGSRVGTSKLTDEKVAEIRNIYSLGKTTTMELAKQFGVSSGVIKKAICGKSWSHVALVEMDREAIVEGLRSAGRPRGERSPKAKLTAGQVVEIRARWAAGGVKQRDLGKEFGVSQAAIFYILKGKNWAPVAA